MAKRNTIPPKATMWSLTPEAGVIMERAMEKKAESEDLLKRANVAGNAYQETINVAAKMCGVPEDQPVNFAGDKFVAMEPPKADE